MAVYQMADARAPQPIGQTWMERGYPATPMIEDDPEPCAVCGVPKNSCTGETHQAMSKQTQIRKRAVTRSAPTATIDPEETEIEETEEVESEESNPDEAPDAQPDAPGQDSPTPGVPNTPSAPQTQAERPPGAPKVGRILYPGDKTTFDAEDMGSYLRVKEPVYRQVFRENTVAPTYVLVFPAGHRVPKSMVRGKVAGNQNTGKTVSNVEVK